jgi:hypothetical protein
MGNDDALALLDLPVNAMGVVLIPQARKALLPGERLEFVKALDLYPNDFIERGERCIVVRRDRNSGAVEVFLEGYHAEKTMDVTPHRSSDVLDVLEPYMDAFTEPAIAMRADFTE